MPRRTGNHQKLEEARKILSRAFKSECTSADALMWAANLQNCERINFCCFKPPNLWYFVTVALETKETNIMCLAKNMYIRLFCVCEPKSILYLYLLSVSTYIAMEKFRRMYIKLLPVVSWVEELEGYRGEKFYFTKCTFEKIKISHLFVVFVCVLCIFQIKMSLETMKT